MSPTPSTKYGKHCLAGEKRIKTQLWNDALELALVRSFFLHGDLACWHKMEMEKKNNTEQPKEKIIFTFLPLFLLTQDKFRPVSIHAPKKKPFFCPPLPFCAFLTRVENSKEWKMKIKETTTQKDIFPREPLL